jgi:hypothetical protein
MDGRKSSSKAQLKENQNPRSEPEEPSLNKMADETCKAKQRAEGGVKGR